MATDFFIKQSDTAPPIVVVLNDASEDAVDLSTSSSIMFIMSNKLTGEVVVEAAADLLDADSGQVQYQWQTGDTDAAGVYKAEFEVTWDDGTIETFPNSKYISIKVVVDLGGTVG